MSPGFAGIHHLALYTHDLEETLQFYAVVLELDVSAIADSPRGRHAFVHLEPADSGRRGLHFWESDKVVKPDVRARLAAFTSGPGALAHLALYQPNPAAATALRTRLDVDGIAVIDFEELGTYAISDPNGIMVEVAVGRRDAP